MDGLALGFLVAVIMSIGCQVVLAAVGRVPTK